MVYCVIHKLCQQAAPYAASLGNKANQLPLICANSVWLATQWFG